MSENICVNFLKPSRMRSLNSGGFRERTIETGKMNTDPNTNHIGAYYEAVMADFEGTQDERACIAETIKQATSLLVTHWRDIHGIIVDDGQDAVSFGVTIKKFEERFSGITKLSFSKKHTDSGEFMTPDFKQAEFNNLNEMVMKHHAETLTAKIKRAKQSDGDIIFPETKQTGLPTRRSVNNFQ